MKITIPTPCHENWNEMTPNEMGRHCTVCSKTVKDFTDQAYTDALVALAEKYKPEIILATRQSAIF